MISIQESESVVDGKAIRFRESKDNPHPTREHLGESPQISSTNSAMRCPRVGVAALVGLNLASSEAAIAALFAAPTRQIRA